MHFSNKQKALIYSCIMFFISLVIIGFVAFFSQNCNHFQWDDAWYSYYISPKENCFTSLSFNYMHGSGYIGGMFLEKFLCYKLPLMLGIHPGDFIGLPNGIFRGIFSACILYSMTLFCRFFNKSKILHIQFYLLIFLVVFYFLTSSLCIQFVNYTYYRYFFSFLFFNIFWIFVIKNIMGQKKKVNYIALIFASLCGYILGTSIEILFIASIITCFLIFVYNIMTTQYLKHNKNRTLWKSLKIHLGRTFYIPCCSLLLGTSLFLGSPSFRQLSVDDRGLGSTIISNDLIREFFSLLYKIYFQEHIHIWCVLGIVFAISLFFAVKKHEIKKLIFPVFLVVSIVLTLISLISGGKTHYDGSFWINHLNIQFLFKMTMFYTILYLLSYSLKNLMHTKILRKRKAVVLVILGIFLVGTYYKQMPIIIDRMSSLNNYVFRCKQRHYVFEKILHFYYSQNKRPILPKETSKQGDYFSFVFESEQPYYKDNSIATSYYPRTYKNLVSKELGFTFEDNSIKKFYENGGCFTADEIKNVKFGRLFDEKNIKCEQKTDILPYQEVEEDIIDF